MKTPQQSSSSLLALILLATIVAAPSAFGAACLLRDAGDIPVLDAFPTFNNDLVLDTLGSPVENFLNVFRRRPDGRDRDDREVVKVEGIYKVPTPADRTDLLEAAKFDVKFKLVYFGGELRKISYKLPAQLTGYENDIDLAPLTQDKSVWGGNNSEGSCDVDAEGLSCKLEYTDLALNAAAAERVIRTDFAGDELATGRRIEVMRSFITEPCGVFTVRR